MISDLNFIHGERHVRHPTRRGAVCRLQCPRSRCLRGLLCPGFQRLSHADRDAEHSRQGALRAFYAQHRFNNPLLKAELLSRTVLGNKVFYHEKIHGLSPEPIESVAVFEVKEGLIQTAWFYFPS